MIRKTAIALSFLTGLGMIFLGARFLLFPEIAEAGYGIHFNELGDYSFHYIKGIRDLFSGIVICLLLLTRQSKALGITVLAGTIIPITDLFIVSGNDYTGITAAMPHVVAIIICSVCGCILVPGTTSKVIRSHTYVSLISSARSTGKSVVELNILPGEKTPWHYHTLFSETFEIVKGTLEVGKGKNVLQLQHGDTATIEPGEKHYYHNISKKECIIRVTINPGNENFEKALFILKGLAQDGLSSPAGTPRKFTDLALFVYLSNSRMSGIQKIAEPVFRYAANTAIKKGALNDLVARYC